MCSYFYCVGESHLLFVVSLYFKNLVFSARLGSNSNENKKLIASAGGIPIILRSMQLYPDDAHVQEQACGALWTLTNAPSNLKILRAENNAREILKETGENFPEECKEYVDDVMRRCRYS